MRWTPSLEATTGSAFHRSLHCAARGWAGWGCAMGEDYAQRVGSGIYLRLALAPAQKTLSGKIVTKCHDFHSSWRSAEFWNSQHEFLSSSGSK